ncbi:MAG: LD-carboxypeptidase [Duodenibacillus sp.]|nr:LD-carboxypeptidase [Duodenibacillus sp.]
MTSHESGGMRTPVLTVTAPSRALVCGEGWDAFDAARFERISSRVSALGWQLRFTDNVRLVRQRFAGDEATRARCLTEALRDPDTDLVMALRGGYGATRLLSLLDWKSLAEYSAPLIGLSDVTALTMALLAKAGKPGWQGPTLSWFDHNNDACDAAFMKAMREPRFLIETPAAGDEFSAEGILWGGNLTLIESLIGTEYLPRISGGIFVFEDVAEPAWRVDRMLNHLADAGILGSQKAILVGSLRGADDRAGAGQGRFDLGHSLEFIRQKCGLPIATGLPFGHIPETVTLPIGCSARVSLRHGKLTIAVDEPPVPANAPGVDAVRSPQWWF